MRLTLPEKIQLFENKRQKLLKLHEDNKFSKYVINQHFDAKIRELKAVELYQAFEEFLTRR